MELILVLVAAFLFCTMMVWASEMYNTGVDDLVFKRGEGYFPKKEE